MPNFVYKAVGCEECRQTGYKGRVGIYEFMPISLEAKQRISAGVTLDDLKCRQKKKALNH